MLINQVAKKYAISVRTLRYYESIGLLKSKRNATNTRYYDDNQVRQIEQVLILKTLGLSLRDIKFALAEKDSAKLHELLRAKLNKNARMISSLNYQQSLITSVLTLTEPKLSLLSIVNLIEEHVYLKEDELMKKVMEGNENIMVEFGEAIIPFAADQTETGLVARIKQLRQQLRSDEQINFGLIRIRDDIKMAAHDYRISFDGRVVYQDSIEDDCDCTVEKMIAALERAILSNATRIE